MITALAVALSAAIPLLKQHLWCWQLAYTAAAASSAQVIATRSERVVIGRSNDWLDAYLCIGALSPTAGECSYLFVWHFHLFWRFHHQRQQ